MKYLLACLNSIERITKWIMGDRRLNSDRRKHITADYKKSNRRKKERRK